MSETSSARHTPPNITASPLLLAAVALAAALATYLATGPQTITLEDAGLFQMVCHLDGLSHPPGYPLFTLLCQTVVKTPAVWNANLLSAVFGALTIGVFTLLLSGIFKQRSIVVIGALAYGGSLTFWAQAIIVEVYTLAAFLFYCCWLSVANYARRNDIRWWYLGCLVFGLNLANHWPLALLSAPALLAVVWPARANLINLLRQPTVFCSSILLFTLGLTPYISLVTAPADAFGVFGSINHPQELLQYVTRGLYDDTKASADINDRIAFFQWLPLETIRQLGPIATAIAAFGLYWSFRVGPKHIASAALLNYLGATFVLTGIIGFECHGQAIFLPYPIIAYGSLAIWLAFGLQGVYQIAAGLRWKSQPTLVTPVLPLLAMIVLVIIVATNYPLNNRRQDAWVENYFRMMLATLPANAVLFTEGDILSFPLGYLHHVRKIRPDITLYNWHSLTYPNRLSPVFATTAQKEAAIINFVAGTKRPVFVIKPTLSPLVSYGIYNKVRHPGEPAAVLLPEAEQWLDEMLRKYDHAPPTRQQEIELLEFIFAGFTRTYLVHQNELAIQGTSLDDLQQKRLAGLMQTFSGKMMLLEQVLATVPETARKDPTRTAMLRQLIAAAAAQIPDHITNEQRARYYYYAARVQLMEPPEIAVARQLLEDSLTLNPAANNPAHSLINQLDSPSIQQHSTQGSEASDSPKR